MTQRINRAASYSPPVVAAGFATGGVTQVPAARGITRDYPLTEGGKRYLLGVADGIGDPPSAEAQATEALARLEATAARSPQEAPAAAVLDAGYSAANEALEQLTQLPGGVAGAGVAMTAALIDNLLVTAAHLGRGAVFLGRGSVVQRLTPGQPRTGEGRQLLGSGSSNTPQILPAVLLEPGDTLLICSQGVARLLGEQVIAAVLDEYGPVDAAQELADLAVQEGKSTCAAVTLIHVPALQTPAATAPPIVGRRRPRWLAPVVVLAAIAVGAIATAGIIIAATRGGAGTSETPAATTNARIVASASPAPPTVIAAVRGTASPLPAAALSPRGTPAGSPPPTRTGSPAFGASPTVLPLASLAPCDSSNKTPCRYTAKAGDSVSAIDDRFNITRDCFAAANRQHQPIPPQPPDYRIGINEEFAVPDAAGCTALIAASATPATAAPGAPSTARPGAPTAAATVTGPGAAETPLPICTPKPGASAPNPLC